MTGYELMLLQGWPADMLKPAELAGAGVTDSLLRDIAGNAFSLNCFLVVLIACLVHVPPEAVCPATQGSSEDPEQAVAPSSVAEILDL